MRKADRQPTATGRSLAENAAVWLLAVSAILAPACLGASGIWARWSFEGVMTLAAVMWCTSKPRPSRAMALPLVAVCIGLLQLIPLPDSILLKVAPISAGAWKVALAGSATGCISVDPAATLAALCRLLLALATVVIVSDLGRDIRHRLILTRAVAASGLVIILAAMIFGRGRGEDFTMMSGLVSLRGPTHPLHSPLILPVQGGGVGSIDTVTIGNQHYLVDSPYTGDGCGFYIYSNHFAGGVALTLPVLIAVFLGFSRERLPAATGLVGAFGLACVGLWAVGWLAESKAGVVSLVTEGLVLAALVTERPWPKRIAAYVLVATVIAGVLAAAILLGPFQAAFIQSLPETGQQIAMKIIAANGRMLATLVGLRMFRASPLLGTGLNSYQSIFPRFQQGNSTFFYAHSDWAQLLAEWGFAGASTALVCVWALCRRGWQFYRNSPAPQRIVDAGAWAAVAGITFYSAFDWNLHLPANALLACIVFGLAVSSVPPGRASQVRTNRPLQIGVQAAFVMFCLAAFGWLTRDAHSEAVKRELSRAIVADRIAMAKPDAPSPLPRIVAAIKDGESAAAFDPRNARLLVLMGQANLHLAARTAYPAARDAIRHLADRWFAKARRASAVCRGLPSDATTPR